MQEIKDECFVAKNTTMELFEAITELKIQLKELLQIRIDEITNEFLLGFQNPGELCESACESA